MSLNLSRTYLWCVDQWESAYQRINWNQQYATSISKSPRRWVRPAFPVALTWLTFLLYLLSTLSFWIPSPVPPWSLRRGGVSNGNIGLPKNKRSNLQFLLIRLSRIVDTDGDCRIRLTITLHLQSRSRSKHYSWFTDPDPIPGNS